MAAPSFYPMVLRLWGELELIAPAPGGNRNLVWRGRIGHQRCVVRRSERSADGVAWELELLAAAAREGLGVPRLLRTLDGRTSVDGVIVQSYVEGRPPNGLRDWRAVADYLAVLHDRVAVPGQRPSFASSQDLLTADSGGDVDLTLMPDEAAQACRRAWARLEGCPRSAVHGDPGTGNVLMTSSGVVLVDWDESRVDCSLFDLAALPREASPLSDEEWWIASRAASAWEAAVSWAKEPDYALRRLQELSL